MSKNELFNRREIYHRGSMRTPSHTAHQWKPHSARPFSLRM